MRRFRRRRRRIAAAALLPIAAIFMVTAASAAAPKRDARIDTSDARVSVGETVALRGAFPGASKAPFEIRYRENGEQRWSTVAQGRTGAGGRYRVHVHPRRTGYWRAALSRSPQTQAASAGPAPAPEREPAIDRGTGSERISVRSETTIAIAGRHLRVGQAAKFRGTVTPAGAERRVVIRIGNAERTTRTGRDGRFAIRWTAPSTGTYPVEVAARSNEIAGGSHDSAGKITAYRAAAASWYGPGLYGGHLACGGTLTPSTIGVAHRTLPCGTKLRLRYRGRSVDVRVIDRGPYSGSREFDLTETTKRKLGFPDLGTVLSSR
jgi:rare lipoprotein A